MNIGIDIDDTTVTTYTSLIKYANMYDTKVLGRNGYNGSMESVQNKYYLNELYGWDYKTKSDFFNTYYKNVLEECEMKPDAPEIIRKFKQEGNNIFFITARIKDIPECDTEGITKKAFKDYNIPYDKLIINSTDKLKHCLENGIEIYIEDSFDICKELEQSGIKTFLMTTPMNRNTDIGTIERVETWKEIYEKVRNFIKKQERDER